MPINTTHRRPDGSTFHLSNTDQEEKRAYAANTLCNNMLRSFGKEFDLDMSPYIQEQPDIFSTLGTELGTID